MTTNLALDDHLIETAVKAGKHRSKRDADTQAFEEYIQHHRQQEFIELFGTIDYDPNYDYKEQRQRS